jgi:methylthioribulose-1-phosphate dehydratase
MFGGSVLTETGSNSKVIEELATTGRLFYQRAWVLGTSGNFSAVVSVDPLALAITASGIHKGELTADDFLTVDSNGIPRESTKAPSAETALHLTIVRETGARAVLHTHSVWSALLTDLEDADGISIEGFEMLKGLSGVHTHEHREWLPILENSQDYGALSGQLKVVLKNDPDIHAILLRRHGLYTWGRDVPEARRHVEVSSISWKCWAGNR